MCLRMAAARVQQPAMQILLCQAGASVWTLACESIQQLPCQLPLAAALQDAPYDPSQDSVLQRVRFMFGES